MDIMHRMVIVFLVFFPAYFAKELIFALLVKMAIFLILKLSLALVAALVANTTAMERVHHAIQFVLCVRTQQQIVCNVQLGTLKVQSLVNA